MAHLDACELDGRVEDDRIRSGDGDQTAVRPANPGDVVSILEAHEQLGAHLHFALYALNDPYDSGMMMSRRHEVDDTGDAAPGRDLGVEHHRVTSIPADVRPDWFVGCDLPAAMLVLAEQLGETASRVEPRQTQPVD